MAAIPKQRKVVIPHIGSIPTITPKAQVSASFSGDIPCFRNSTSLFHNFFQSNFKLNKLNIAYGHIGNISHRFLN